MTLRKDVSAGHVRNDELDALIRRSLRERVAEASPPPEVWERICARVERPAIRRRLRSRSGYQVARALLSQMGAFLWEQAASWMWPQGRWVEWRFDHRFTRILFDQYQYGFFWLRLAF